MGWVIALVVLAGTWYLAKLAWSYSYIPPKGCTVKVLEPNQRFEKVAILDSNGKEVASNYTSVYGLKGAARESIREAKIRIFIENRNPKEAEKMEQKFNARG